MKNTSSELFGRKRDAAREDWIMRFNGYFGKSLCLDEYRAGKLSFEDLYSSSIRHVGDMLHEAGRYDPIAWDSDGETRGEKI